jgi:hypothetical protein
MSVAAARSDIIRNGREPDLALQLPEVRHEATSVAGSPACRKMTGK